MNLILEFVKFIIFSLGIVTISKYMNSPESDIFIKGKTLYNCVCYLLDRAL